MEKVIFLNAIPNSFENNSTEDHVLYVIEDFMSEALESINLRDCFTKTSHHKNISIILILQNLFFKSKHARTISLNVSYIYLMKSLRFECQYKTFLTQIFPSEWKFAFEVYKVATRKKYSYLLIDLKSSTPDVLRLRSNVIESNQNSWGFVHFNIQKFMIESTENHETAPQIIFINKQQVLVVDTSE